ncbi:DUF4115 domain-containing protein [Thalassotalea ponticola]|uniref:RodZ domain-containing protein n=1 Tax=Thalassotalea ponticola TaxID=1523392 RepID=UPI0025B4647E|nr:RodZ domain-containing protein [Thalassotalea ponticola]MDN3653387.1 DUF4115 domain-containing protein [Thalassotalea ponticola]
MSEQPDNASEQIVPLSPGTILRQARELMQLSQQEVADKLNLRLSLIEEIEADDFSGKTPKTFVRGYLRNYAKLVNVDQQSLLEAFEQYATNASTSASMTSFSQGTQKQAEHNRLMIVIYILIIALIASTIIWWSQQASNVSTQPIDNQLSPADNLDSQPSAPPVTVEESSVDSTSLTDTEDTQDTTVANDLDSGAMDDPVPQDEVFEQHMQQTAAAALANERDNAVNATGQVVVNEGSDSAVAEQDTLQFRFAGDCWVNIFDASGERLAWGIKKAGYVMTLSGQAPFQITLGKPDLVALTYNNETIDLSGYQPGQIAKFRWPVAPEVQQ